jgi:hypothetical protein
MLIPIVLDNPLCNVGVARLKEREGGYFRAEDVAFIIRDRRIPGKWRFPPVKNSRNFNHHPASK